MKRGVISHQSSIMAEGNEGKNAGSVERTVLQKCVGTCKGKGNGTIHRVSVGSPGWEDVHEAKCIYWFEGGMKKRCTRRHAHHRTFGVHMDQRPRTVCKTLGA
jgi:hypothetical protein